MAKIIKIDTIHNEGKRNCTSNGSGFRIIVWFLGCDIKCPGCHNKQYWDFNNPDFEDFSDKHIQFIFNELKSNKNTYSGLSILGGEPFSIFNIDDTLELVTRFKHEFPDKDIWIWSGHTFDWLERQDGFYGSRIKEILNLCSFLVDGPFDKNRRNISLKFRGSDNQRIINLKTKEVVS